MVVHCMLKKRLTCLFPSLYPVLKICDQCHGKIDTFPVASFELNGVYNYHEG